SCFDPPKRVPFPAARTTRVGTRAYTLSVPVLPASDTCSVHALPSQYRNSCRPRGSGCQPAGVALAVAGGGDGAADGAGPDAGAAAGGAATPVTVILPMRNASHGACHVTPTT